MRNILKSTTAIAAAAMVCGTAYGADFNIPAGDLSSVLAAYTRQTGVTMFYAADEMQGKRSHGIVGNVPADEALSRILSGTGFGIRREGGGVEIIRDPSQPSSALQIAPIQIAQAAPARPSVETVTVTSSKLGGADVQSIPIAITALSQEQLTSRQVAGGPDLVKEVPNLTFSKTNFTGYNIQIRGIGTQAISVTTDPAVAVALNDLPFIRNHFFEQEFYDVAQVEILRGPQGTLYGRNATAGVVNVTSAKPTDQFEAMASADIGNYHNRRFEGMINLPVVDDRLDLRVAAEWTKRDGYSFNSLTNSPIDGRDLWSGRATIGFKPSDNFRAYLIWEHFQEDDDRLRTSKQLCKRDPGPSEVNNISIPGGGDPAFLSQGCLPTSMYSADAFEVVNGFSLPYFGGLTGAGQPAGVSTPIIGGRDPYASVTQSRDLRVIESALNPTYKAKNDVLELNVDYEASPSLTFTSQTGFNHDYLWSTEDFNRFNTVPGIFLWAPNDSRLTADGGEFCDAYGNCSATAAYCDPQLGCSDRLVAEDLSTETAWQLNQEFRFSSHFGGPLNFSVGGNYLHYETDEKYYVFINTLTLFSDTYFITSTAEHCQNIREYPDVHNQDHLEACRGYIDPNPIGKLDDQGHNYFLSHNPYVLNSYAGFGEVYYTPTNDLKLIGGVRWTDDQKHFIEIPSELLTDGYGYPVIGVLNQGWKEWTGRFTANWTPHLAFTDQTLIYGSFGHGYKAGGANPPSAVLLTFYDVDITNPVHPLTFRPEFINSFEIGTKNTALDGEVTFNGNLFYYDYKDYQISEIVDRTAVNLNFDATVKGAEIETSWEPLPGLKFSFAGGYEDGRLANGSKAVDLMDRTAGHSGWMIVKPFVTQASNCVLPTYVVQAYFEIANAGIYTACGSAYAAHIDPLTQRPYELDPTTDYQGNPLAPGIYPGFDPVNPGAPNNGAGPAPNNGAGFDKNLGGNELPNAPHFTTSVTAEFSIPISGDWAGTLHSDFYWQSQSYARVFNDEPYDRVRGYTNLNLALIFTNSDGWQAIGYMKNVFNTTAITGAFLNSDDTGLTTNVFLTDPRLFGVRVTKNF